MSVDPSARHGASGQHDDLRAARSLRRPGAVAAVAAVVGAVVLAGAIVLLGWEVVWFAPMVGAAVGAAASVVADGEVGRRRVGLLSVLLTQLGLMLCSYVVLWLYREDRFAPAPISLADAAAETWERLVEEPVGLVFWVLTLVTAYGAGSDVDGDVGTSTAVGFDGPFPVVQVVAAYANPARSADLDLAVVMRRPDGSFCLRLVSLAASDLRVALRHLAAADPDELRHARGLVHGLEVSDEVFASATAAMSAVYEEAHRTTPRTGSNRTSSAGGSRRTPSSPSCWSPAPGRRPVRWARWR